MAQFFFDTSAAVKYYHNEAGSQKIFSIFAEPDRKIRISNLGLLELHSAFAMKVRSGVVDRPSIRMYRARLLLNIAAGDIEVYGITEDHFMTAEVLIDRHGFSNRLRTLDALQLAVALDLAEQDLLDYFVVADRSLGGVAADEGLNVINPEID